MTELELRPITLNDIAKMMISDDYKVRVQAEYVQLKLRIEGLKNMLEKWENGTLIFEPKTPKKLYEEQLDAMIKYSSYLESRMKIDKIPFNNLILNIESKTKIHTDVIIRYHRELFPELQDVIKKGNFVDLRAAETVSLKAGEFALINLGVSIKLPEGYWGQFVPRSSTFKNFGIIQTNSFAVIDSDYCGDNDIWKMPVYATRDITIPANTRICQFRIVKDNSFNIVEVEKLEGPDRGGFGSTGNM